jgi:hypothetical protein
VSRNTVRKVLRSGKISFEYERVVQPRPKLGRWAAKLDRLLAPPSTPGNQAEWIAVTRRRRGLTALESLKHRALDLLDKIFNCEFGFRETIYQRHG